MSKYIIYHNPRCSKSRQGLNLLSKNNIKPEIILYLKNPPTVEDLQNIVKILAVRPIDICRTKESIFKELDINKDTSDSDILDAISKNPVILERPIVIKDNKTGVIGRPENNILRLIK